MRFNKQATYLALILFGCSIILGILAFEFKSFNQDYVISFGLSSMIFLTASLYLLGEYIEIKPYKTKDLNSGGG